MRIARSSFILLQSYLSNTFAAGNVVAEAAEAAAVTKEGAAKAAALGMAVTSSNSFRRGPEIANMHKNCKQPLIKERRQ